MTEKRPERELFPRIDPLTWEPDPDKIREALLGSARSSPADFFRTGDSTDGGSQDSD